MTRQVSDELQLKGQIYHFECELGLPEHKGIQLSRSWSHR